MFKINTKSFLFYFCLAILFTGALDFITFWMGRSYAFEINPLFLLTKSVLLLFLVKVLVLSGLCYLLLSTPKHQITQFLWVSIGFYVIFIQLIGAYSNLKIQVENPPESSVLEPTVAVKSYINLSVFYLYYPVVFSVIVFQMWRWCFKNDRDKT